MRLWPWIAGLAAVSVAATLFKAPDLRAAFAKMGDAWDKLHPAVKAAAARVVDEANQEFADDGLTVGIYEGWRDIERQQEHIASGTSFVSDALNSYHVWGLAVDFVFLDRLGRWTWLPDPDNPSNTAYRDPRWYRLGEIIKRNGFQWGGDWKQFDGPHGEMKIETVSNLRRLYADDPYGYVEQNIA